MKQHSVPENIMDVEFKLFGSLTAKQFGYILGGGVLALVLFFVFKEMGSMLLAWIFAGLSVILGLSLALIRINDQPFEIWLGNFLAAMFTSQKRIWKKEKKKPEALSTKKPEPSFVSKTVSPTDVRGVSQMKPGGVTVQKPQTKEPSVPQHPFKSLDQQGPQAPNTVPTQPVPVPTGVPVNPNASTIAGNGTKGDYQFVPGSAQRAVRMASNQQPNRPIYKSNPEIPKQNNTGMAKQSVFLHNDAGRQPAGNVSSPGSVPVPSGGAVTPSTTSGSNTTAPSGQPSAQGLNQGAIPSVSLPKDATGASPTQAGSFPASSASQASLPNKADLYSDVVPDKSSTIKSVSNDYSNAQQPANTSPTEDLHEENKALRQKVAEMTESKTKSDQELANTKKMSSDVLKQNEQIVEQMKSLQKEVQSLKKSAEVKDKLLPPITAGDDKVSDSFGGLLSPKVYNGPSLSKKPNVISGIVKSKDGNLLPGVVVIVKNERNRPVRAMKTNSLGQFLTTTALENGTYTLELTKNEYTFGKYEVELTGEVMATYEFIAE